MSLLAQAQAAHEQRCDTIARVKMDKLNAELKAKIKAAFGLDVDPQNNRYTDADDKVTLTVHEGKLHVLYTCEKCQLEYRSFHPVATLADLHLAATEEPRMHPPCFGARRSPASITVTPDQVTQ